MNPCPDPPVIEYPDCGDLTTTAADMDVWLMADAILESARCIAEESPCQVHKCPDGRWLTGNDSEHGIQIGAPTVKDCCCGGIVVGSRYPISTPDRRNCVAITEVEFDLVVSWPCESHQYIRYIERARFDRLLESTICCKLSEDGKGSGCKHTPYLIGIVDTVDEPCPQITFTFKVRT